MPRTHNAIINHRNNAMEIDMQLQTLPRLDPTDLDSRWKAFAAVSSYPRSVEDIAREAGLTLGNTYNQLAVLENNDLVRCHSERHCEWILTDA